MGLEEGVNHIVMRCPSRNFADSCEAAVWNVRTGLDTNIGITRHPPERGNSGSKTHYSAASWVNLSPSRACFTCVKHGWCTID